MRAIIAALAALCIATPALAWSLADMNNLVDRSNVIVGQGCSGTIISVEERLVLTNYHCIARNVRVETEQDTGRDGIVNELRREVTTETTITRSLYIGHVMSGVRTDVADIVAHARDMDLALLQIRNPLDDAEAPAFRPLESTVLRGEEAFAVGNPMMFESSITKGIISSTVRTSPMRGMKKDMQVYQYSGGITGGNSGGALYDAEGLFIGIPFAVATSATFMGFIIPHTEIIPFLAKHCFADLVGEENEDSVKCMRIEMDRAGEAVETDGL